MKAGQNMSIPKRKSANVTAPKKRYLDRSHTIPTAVKGYIQQLRKRFPDLSRSHAIPTAVKGRYLRYLQLVKKSGYA